MYPYPRIGVGVILLKDNLVAMGLRKSSHGAQTWCNPGGHLEFGESVSSCAIREVYEETGLIITQTKVIGITNDFFEKEQKHYVSIFLAAQYEGGNLINKEPHKCYEMRWVDWNNMPTPLFSPLTHLIATHDLSLARLHAILTNNQPHILSDYKDNLSCSTMSYKNNSSN